ncbi:SDR family oxidoreductase [Sinomonas sp. ASV322]|uniref:SDR family oxidoreductase n=1 Tax=Sinomonas sp. ASV322 TaxID=3041920 RepID=UPI0027DCA01F|nr:SDR family oxidoreductase [Sinomonas sp. ASV322]MDQ4503072.1 SDR family oxidoreductase [Sinomonas sp. ASV322]
MARIAVIGGHGKIALLLEPLLAARGDVVTAIIRTREHTTDVAATGAHPVVADVETLDTTGIAELLAGHDAVVWSAGAGGGNPARTYAVDRDAAIRSMDAAGQAGVRRYVMVSYLGARADHGVPPEHSFFPYAEAKAAADEYLRSSPLDWTIVAPSTLTLGPGTGRIGLADHTNSSRVSREDVAAVLAAVLEAPGTIGKFVGFNQGQTPIAEALASF